jgi:hypothetical protein
MLRELEKAKGTTRAEGKRDGYWLTSLRSICI